MSVRVTTIRLRVPAAAPWAEAINAAIRRVERADGRVLQVVDRFCHSYGESEKRKTEDWSITLLVESSSDG